MRRLVAAVLTASLALPAYAASTVPATAGVSAPTTITAYVGNTTSPLTTHTMVAGDSPPVSGAFRVAGATAADLVLDLWAKPYGEAWRRVTSDTTDSAGRAHVSRAPSKLTYYRWRFAGDATRDAATSNTVTVKVATKIGLALADSSIASGQRVVATGRTRPAKPGNTAILWSHRPTSRTKLASPTVRSDGTYRIRKVMRCGSYSLYVTVSAGGGNLAGHVRAPHPQRALRRGRGRVDRVARWHR